MCREEKSKNGKVKGEPTKEVNAKEFLINYLPSSKGSIHSLHMWPCGGHKDFVEGNALHNVNNVNPFGEWSVKETRKYF